MKRLWGQLVALTAEREPATTLAIFRIAVALVMFYSLLSVAGAGLLEVLWTPPSEGGYSRALHAGYILRWLGGPTADAVWTLWGTSFAAAALVLVGLFGRVAALVGLQCYAELTRINPDASGGYDALIVNALWLLALSRCTETLSLGRYLRTRSFVGEQSVPAWPRYLAILQLVLLYTATGLQKASPVWTPLGGYSALYWVFQDPTWLRRPMDFVAWAYPLTQLASAVTWWWEVSAPLLLLAFYYRRTAERPGRLRAFMNRIDLRRYWAALGVALHVGILLALNVGPFSWISMAYYVCLWRPEEWRAWGARVGRCQRMAPSFLRPGRFGARFD